MLIWLLLAVIVLCVCWWGSNIVFHPPEMLTTLVRPEAFGLPCENVSFSAKDGVTLRGWLIAAAESTPRTILLCHGWGDNKGDVLQRLHWLRRRFNLFLFDSRGHGESEGTICTLGYLESFDFAAAMEFLKQNRPAWAARLGVCGLSMGAAMAIYGMAHDANIRCAVLEAPFGSFHRVVRRFAWNAYRLPCIPLVWLVLLTVRLRLGGADPEPYSPVYHIKGLTGRPTLFIAGTADRLMPLPEVQALYNNAGEPKELWIIPEGRHGRYEEAAGEEYERRIFGFFEKHL